jgi:hypothetical protein
VKDLRDVTQNTPSKSSETWRRRSESQDSHQAFAQSVDHHNPSPGPVLTAQLDVKTSSFTFLSWLRLPCRPKNHLTSYHLIQPVAKLANSQNCRTIFDEFFIPTQRESSPARIPMW